VVVAVAIVVVIVVVVAAAAVVVVVEVVLVAVERSIVTSSTALMKGVFSHSTCTTNYTLHASMLLLVIKLVIKLVQII